MKTLDLKQQQNQINTYLVPTFKNLPSLALGTVSGCAVTNLLVLNIALLGPYLIKSLFSFLSWYPQFLSFSLTVPIQMPYKILIIH